MMFAKPESFYWFLIFLPLGAAWLSHVWWKRRVSAQVGHQPLIEAMSARFSPGRALARTLLFVGAMILCIIALAQPQWGMTEREIKRMGVDVVFALDLSNSMLAEDAAPNRLKAAAEEMRTVMSRLDGDRVGLVIFTSISFPQSPLTTDYAAINFFLSKIHPDQIPVGGTSVGAATRESIELLIGKKLNDQAADSHVMRRAKNQVIVLVTDGEDHESDPLATADFAAQHGISLVTVGIGDPNGAQIPTFDKNGRKTGVMRDETGAPVITKLDETTLKQMAQKAGGLYLHYTGKNSVANGIVNYLNELEKTELDSLLRQRYKDRYMFFLAPALLMLLVSFSLGQRRRSTKKSVDPQMLKKTSVTTVLTLLSLMLIATANTGCDETFRSTLSDIDNANGLLNAGRFDDALAAYKHAEPQVGNTNEYQYNLGRAHLSTGEFAIAQSHLARALATDDPNLKFDVLYNLGLALAGQDLWPQAYETFKQALMLGINDPETYSSERYQNARHNLELAYRKLFPPCAELEDDLEPNDSMSQASKLENLKAEDRTLCGLNDDWIAIPVSLGSLVKVTAKFKALRETPDPEHVFLPQPDDLQLILFDDRGTETVSIDEGLPLNAPADLARINKQQRTQREIKTLRVTQEMLQTGQNQLYLKVAATEGLEFKYDLEIEVIPPCSELDDKFESNDSARIAVPITPGNHPLHICPGNEDWFRIDVQAGDSFFVDLQAGEDVEKKSAPEMALEIVDATTYKPIVTGRTEGPYVTAGLQNILKSGEYLIRIRGADIEQQGPYSFDLHMFEPCPIGEDRYAPNHAAQQPAELDPNTTIHRYLRICENNPDHFLVPVGEDKSIELGLSAVTTDRAVINATSTASPSFDLDLLSQNDGSVVASAVEPQAPQDDGAPRLETSLALSRVLIHPDIEEENALVRVTGDPGFYHLVALNPPDSEDQDDKEEDKQEQDEDKKEDDEKSEDEKSEDEKSEDEKSEDKDKKEDEKSEDEKSKDGDDPSKQEPEKPAEPEDAEKAAADQQSEQEADSKHVQDILQALEDADDNFQMQKALENMPARLIEKNW